MREYGRVYSGFWTSDDIRGMSEDGRTLAFYLLTSPHTTIVGAMRLPDGYVCEDLNWTAGRVQKGFAELSAKGYADRCETTKWVWIRKFLTWNSPENPNQWKAANRLASQIPAACAWRVMFSEVFEQAGGQKLGAKAHPSATLSQPFRNQDQESEQEQEVGARTKPRASRLPADFGLTPERRAIALTESVDPEREFAKFTDHWRSATKNATKLDWDAAWRNWCRSEFAPKVRGGDGVRWG